MANTSLLLTLFLEPWRKLEKSQAVDPQSTTQTTEKRFQTIVCNIGNQPDLARGIHFDDMAAYRFQFGLVASSNSPSDPALHPHIRSICGGASVWRITRNDKRNCGVVQA